MTQGRSILLFGIWLTMVGAGPCVSMASAPADTTAQDTAALTVALTAEGINFLVGHDVRLNEQSVEITLIDMLTILLRSIAKSPRSISHVVKALHELSTSASSTVTESVAVPSDNSIIRLP